MLRTLLLLSLLWSSSSHAADAQALMRAGRLAEALPLAEAEAVAAPQDLDAQERFIDLLLSLGQHRRAVEFYRDRAQRKPDAAGYYLLGRAVQEVDLARGSYETSLEFDPTFARSYMGLGAIQRATGETDAAVMSYAKALELDPSLGEAWVGLTAAELARGNSAAALAAAREGVKYAPKSAESYLALSVLAPEEAVTVLTQGVNALPDARLYAALSEELLNQGDGLGALQAAEAALLIDPSRTDARLSLLFAEAMAAGTLDAEGYRGMVVARTQEQDPFVALATYADLIARYPTCPLPWMGRARVQAARGELDSARADLGKALEADPSNIEAMAAMGMLLVQQGRHSEARPLLERALEARPQDASLAVAAARCHQTLGDNGAALATLDAAQLLRPDDARLVLERARVLGQIGRSLEAYETLREGLKRLPGDDRLLLALVKAAKDLGKRDEAADLLDALATRSNSAELKDMARRLRSGEL